MAERIIENINSDEPGALDTTLSGPTRNELYTATVQETDGPILVEAESSLGGGIEQGGTTSTGIKAFADKWRAERSQKAKTSSVIEYCRHRTNANLVRVLDSDRIEGEVATIRWLLSKCSSSRKGCRLYGCPRCGAKIKRRATLDTLKRIVAKHGKLPDRTSMSFVTILGPTLPLDASVVVAEKKKLRTRLTNFQSTELPSTSWLGVFDITLRGILHWHGVILHGRESRREIKRALKEYFPEERAIGISKWHKEKSDVENLSAVIDYSIPACRHEKIMFDQPSEGEDAALLIGLRIVCLQYMAGRGIHGLRLSLNMRSPRIWKNGVMFDQELGQTIVVPEMEAIILGRRRKTRKDRSWLRSGRIALWPRKRATDEIRGVTSMVTEDFYDEQEGETGPDEEPMSAHYLDAELDLMDDDGDGELGPDSGTD